MRKEFSILNEYYDFVYVLSVESAAERRTLFSRRFEGLQYSFFYGADKNKFSVEEAKEKNIFNEELARQHHRFSKTMKHGEIACSWSHRMMYEDMLAKNYSRVLIMEDDAVPDEKIVARIPEIINEVPEDCELLMWGWAKNGRANFFTGLKQMAYHLQHRFGKLKWDHTIIKHLYAKPFSRYLKRAGFHDYTYAYAINRSGAEKLVKMQTPVQYIADNLLAHAACNGTVKAYITYPAVFVHDNLPDGTHRDSYIR